MRRINVHKLSAGFKQYASSLPSAALVASEATSFESWFRVELTMAILQLGYRRDELVFNYNYPTEENRRRKADICFQDDKTIVFELKTFVSGADANKMGEFPKQNELLRSHVKSGHISQGVSFATFFGYSDQRMKKILGKLYQNPNNWTISGPHKLVDDQPLVFVIAETDPNIA